MSVSPGSLELPIEATAAARPSVRKFDPGWIALFGSTSVALIVMVMAFGGALLIASILAVLAMSIFGARLIRASSPAADTIVLVGRGPMASVIASSLQSSDRRIKNPRTILRATTPAEVVSSIRSLACDEVIFAGDVAPARFDLVDSRGKRPACLSGPEAVERMLGRVPLELVGQDRWFRSLGAVRRVQPSYARAKRTVDLSLAILLSVASLPVILIAAIVIRLDSKGPIVFRQRRMGLGGTPFEILKFRTMRQADERAKSGDWTQEVWTQQDDPRITKVGRFLRASRIDELPQLWNVIKGEMTFVGPRPEWVKSTEKLEALMPDYAKRYGVLPGLTGWAQVRYRYTNSIDGQRRKLEYDLYYVKNASFRLDMQIMIRTALVVLRLKGL